jgi:hypothetical protein
LTKVKFYEQILDKIESLSTDTNENAVTSKIETVKKDSPEEKSQALTVVHNKLYPAKPRNSCKLGYPIRIAANHYPLELVKGFSVYQYDITITGQKKDEEILGNEYGK